MTKKDWPFIAAVAQRRGQLIAFLDGARTLLEMAGRTSDLLSREEKAAVMQAMDLICAVEQSLWSVKP